MMKTWFDIGFEVEFTKDGSPSLRLLQSVDPTKDRGESMHHSGGAFAETYLIYSQPISEVLQKVAQPHFLIVGLGLGYIEMCIAREALLLGQSSKDVGLITSYESLPELRDFFWKWLQGDLFKKDLDPEVFETYETVLKFVLTDTSLSKEQVQVFLRDHFKSVEDIEGSLDEDTVYKHSYHAIMYDAFSSKTTPHLWAEGFVDRLLKEATQKQCLFSTYSCRSSLRQVLQNNDFELVARAGFQGKKKSTLGVRQL